MWRNGNTSKKKKHTTEISLRRQCEITAHTINCSPKPLIFSLFDPFSVAIWYPEQSASKPYSPTVKTKHGNINFTCLLKLEQGGYL